jgi:uracil-DNA glycosylase
MSEMSQGVDNRIHVAIRQRLESLRRAGVRQIPRIPVVSSLDEAVVAERPSEQMAPRTGASARETVSPSEMSVVAPVSPLPPELREPRIVQLPAAVVEEDRLAALERVRCEVVHCTLCHELAKNRTQTVFGTGNPKARLCFFGEAPGADEDRQGEPFVGAAGQLLNKILEACTLKREDVYILNVLKCRPPQNRTPLPEETANCRVFFERQLEIIQPEFICCLGAVASQALLRTTQSLGRLRGRFHDYRGIRVIVTYHPAYLLRSPDKKRDTWEDMKMLMREMGIELPGR